MMFITAVLVSLSINPLVALFGFCKISLQPAGVMNEFRGLSVSPVQGEGGQMGFTERAEYVESLVLEPGDCVFMDSNHMDFFKRLQQ